MSKVNYEEIIVQGCDIKVLKEGKGVRHLAVESPELYTLGTDETFIQQTIETFSDYTKLVNMNLDGKYSTLRGNVLVRIAKPIETIKELKVLQTGLSVLKLMTRASNLTILYNCNGVVPDYVKPLKKEDVEKGSVQTFEIPQSVSKLKSVLLKTKEVHSGKGIVLQGMKSQVVQSIKSKEDLDTFEDYLTNVIEGYGKSHEENYTLVVKWYTEGFESRDYNERNIVKLLKATKSMYRNVIVITQDGIVLLPHHTTFL